MQSSSSHSAHNSRSIISRAIPQLQIAYQTTHEKEYTLKGLFDFLDSQNEHIVIAIDEFQQIRDYPEQNMEALLWCWEWH